MILNPVTLSARDLETSMAFYCRMGFRRVSVPGRRAPQESAVAIEAVSR